MYITLKYYLAWFEQGRLTETELSELLDGYSVSVSPLYRVK